MRFNDEWKDFEVIAKTAVEYLGETLKNAKTFKVSAKRSDKKFPMTSPEISRELGGRILSKYHHLKNLLQLQNRYF